MKIPVVGRIVHYYKEVHDFYPDDVKQEIINNGPLAAIITKVHSNTNVAIHIWTADNSSFDVYMVDLYQDLKNANINKGGFAVFPKLI